MSQEQTLPTQPPHAASARAPRAAGAATAKLASSWGRAFYFVMALLVAAVVVYGFSHTVDQNLLHPPSPRPAILYLHAVLFTGWLLFFIVQSGLVRTRNVQLHRRLGWCGLAMGIAIPIVGVATAIAMGRLHTREGATDAAPSLIVPLFDMVAFSVAFGLAFHWRTRPEFHRRAMLIASCALSAAAFGRFPNAAFADTWFYTGVDALVLLGVLRDLLVVRRVHPVYIYGLPLLVLGQVVAKIPLVNHSPLWLGIAHRLLG
jgi:hypothetical protein